MTDKKGGKSGGGKLTRSETVTVRLNPKLRYLAELGSRHQHRTLSSFIEWAVGRSLGSLNLRNHLDDLDQDLTQLGEELWDIEAPDRLVRLALICPELLNFDEQLQWKAIQEEVSLGREGRRPKSLADVDLKAVRKHWETIKNYADGKINADEFERIVGRSF